MTTTTTQLPGQAVEVRPATDADAAALLRLHDEGFGSGWRPADWRWRFVDNPLGRTEIAGAFAADGRCLAAFCGVSLRCRYRGEAGLANCAGDVVVHPSLRRSIAGPLLLVQTGELFFGTFGGGATRIVYGCPELPLRRTAVRKLRCEILADLPVLVRATGAAAGAEPAVAAGGAAPADADLLWARLAAEQPTGLVRDAAWLRWRYEQHPRVQYRFLSARDGAGALQGLAVVRGGGLHPGTTAIVDWLVPRGEGGVAQALCAAALAAARSAGHDHLVAGFAPRSPEFEQFQAGLGFRVRLSPHQIVFRSYAHGIDRRYLFEEWHHSLGDFDFV